MLRATQLVRSGAGFRARQNQNLVTGLLPPAVAALLPHSTAPSVATRRPFRRPNSEAAVFISSPRFLSSLSRPHHCAFSGFHRTSPVHLPPPAHSPGPACITVLDAHTSRVLFQSRSFLGAKPLCFPCTVSRSEKILIKYLDEKGAHFSTFSITHFQLMPSLLRSVK